MFGIGLGIRVGGLITASGGFDADAQAYFDRVTTAGGTLSTTEKNAVNQLVLDMKSYGIWTSMKAIYPMVGSSAAACAQNLKSSAFTGTFTSGWTYASTGVTPNGTSTYFNTNFNPNVNGLLNSAHYSYYSRTQSILNQSEMGVYVPGYAYGVELSASRNSNFVYNINNAAVSVLNTTSLGLFLSSRTASNILKAHKNGSVFATSSSASINSPNYNIYLGAINEFGNVFIRSTKECAFASIGDGLTDTQASNLYTAVQAFQTTLARQV
jgi:hypothetical protein